MRTTAQNKSSLVWALQWVRRVVPSHLFFEVGSGQVSTPGLFQPPCVSKRSWQLTDGCWSMLKAKPNIKNIAMLGQAGKRRWVSAGQRARVGNVRRLLCCPTRRSHAIQWQTTTNSQLCWCLFWKMSHLTIGVSALYPKKGGLMYNWTQNRYKPNSFDICST